MKKISIVIGVLLMALSCGRNVKESGENYGSIIGIVADKTTGEPVGTVSLTLSPGGAMTVTGSDGSFKFPDLNPGSYTIELEKDGYKQESSSIVVSEGKQTEFHLLIERIPAIISADRDVLDFGDNAGVTQLSVSIVNPGYLDLHWSVTWDNQVKWIREIIGPDGKTEGTLGFGKTASLIVRIDREALSNGYNEAVVVIWSDNGRSELKVTANGADRRTATTNVLPVSDILMNSASLHAEVLSKGSPEYVERGFVLSKSSIATDSSIEGLDVISAPMSTDMVYSADVSNLDNGTHYYVRAYAKNDIGVELSSNQEEFTTIGAWTEVKTQDVSSLDVVAGTVQFNGEIAVEGDPKYIEKGFVYNYSGEPTTDDIKVTVPSNGVGAYSYSCAGLESQRTWYVRAYAIQGEKTFYGSTVNFNTNQSDTEVSTSAASSVTSSSATLNGSIAKEGSPAYTERGFCYGTSENPTINDNTVSQKVSGVGNWSSNISSLKSGTTYYVRAYAMQNGKPVYANQVSFSTHTDPVVETKDIIELHKVDMGGGLYYQWKVTFNGEVTNVGNPAYVTKGFVYGTSSEPRVGSDTSMTVPGTEAGTYSAAVSNLSDMKTYYVRAWVKKSDGKYEYGNAISFNTY